MHTIEKMSPRVGEILTSAIAYQAVVRWHLMEGAAKTARHWRGGEPARAYGDIDYAWLLMNMSKCRFKYTKIASACFDDYYLARPGIWTLAPRAKAVCRRQPGTAPMTLAWPRFIENDVANIFRDRRRLVGAMVMVSPAMKTLSPVLKENDGMTSRTSSIVRGDIGHHPCRRARNSG